MHIFNRTLIIGTLTAILAACSNQDMPQIANSDETVAVPITLNVGVAHNLNITSRSTSGYISDHNPSPRRPVTWTNEQSIEDLRVYVFESQTPNGNYYYTGGGDCKDGGYLIKDFYNLFPWTAEEFETHSYLFTPRLKKGHYYKFLAIGRDDSKGRPLPPGLSVDFIPWGTRTIADADFKIGITEIHEATLTNEELLIQYPYVTTEIFTGYMLMTDPLGHIVEDYVYIEDRKTGFQKDITLHRAVAGFWAYFTDIPTKAIDNSDNPTLHGAIFTPKELIARMTIASKEINLMRRNEALDAMQKQAIAIGYIDFTNQYGEKDDKLWHQDNSSPYWQRDKINDYLGVKIDENCALMANFLMPVDNLSLLNDNEAMFTIELIQSIGRLSTKRNIRCRIHHITDPITGEQIKYGENGYQFPVSANYLYVLGSPDHPISLASLSADTSNGVPSRADDDEIVMTVIQY